MAWARFRKKAMPEGLWSKCTACGATIYQKDAEAKKKVCPECDFHFPINVADRIAFTLDEGSWQELWPDIETEDRLGFVDREPYPDKLKAVMARTGRKEAMVVGLGKIKSNDVVFGALEFKFMGGSMGAVVGEKVTRAIEEASRRRWPLVLVSASGGARMHEGVISLMQMAKTCTALGRFSREGGLYIAILAHPTTGGVTASWATQADVVLAEPGALIGFAGPRVIQTTLRQELPPGFQRSEFLLQRGQIDQIVPRAKIPGLIASLIDILAPQARIETKAPEDPETSQTAPSDGTAAKNDPDARTSADEAAPHGEESKVSAPTSHAEVGPRSARASVPAKRAGAARGAVEKKRPKAKSSNGRLKKAGTQGARRSRANGGGSRES